MRTVVIQVGNSDDKLGQRDWSAFVKCVQLVIDKHVDQIHFGGASENAAPWQNCCWVLSVDKSNMDILREQLVSACYLYKQDSLAWLEGDIELVPTKVLMTRKKPAKLCCPKGNCNPVITEERRLKWRNYRRVIQQKGLDHVEEADEGKDKEIEK